MKLEKLPEKFIAVSWCNWFIQTLKENGFEKSRSSTYSNGDVDVRLFRSEKKYQVKTKSGELLEKLDYTFPHLTAHLYSE